MKIIPQLLISLIAVSAISSNAALYDRGNGMIYDSDQNLTWLQDFGYPTNAFLQQNPDMAYTGGYLYQAQAANFVNDFEYMGYNDWRLPSCLNSLGYCHDGYHGSYPSNPSQYSEIAYLFRVLLGNTQWSGSFNLSFIDGSTGKLSSFSSSVDNNFFWEQEDDWKFFLSSHYADFSGFTSVNGRDYVAQMMVVRDGDVLPLSEVPVPAAAWLMGSGLVMLAGIARSKKQVL